MSMTIRISAYNHGRSLRLDQLAAAMEACPVCGDTAPRRSIGTIQRNPTVELLECGGSSVSHMPLPEVLNEYYAEYYKQEDKPKVTIGSVARMAAHIRRVLPSTLATNPDGLTILDVGGGDGSISVALARLIGGPAQITVVDPSAEPVLGDATIRVGHRTSLDETQGVYDLVIASGVVEHVPAAREFLTGLLERIRPGGLFYARTPYVAPFLRLLPWFDFAFPGHVHDLGPAFWAAVPEVFDPRLRIRHFQTSLVETSWRENPALTSLAYLLKLPSRLETSLRHRPTRFLWPYVGGWEVVFERPGNNQES